MSSFETLAEPFRSKLQELATRIVGAQIPLALYATRRSFREQANLYSKGRELVNGVMVVRDKSKVVTNARAGESPHNWGLAADFVLDLNHLFWSDKTKPLSPWDDGKGDFRIKSVWDALGVHAEDLGLEWGGRWSSFKDLPHVELKFWRRHRPHNWQALLLKEMESN